MLRRIRHISKALACGPHTIDKVELIQLSGHFMHRRSPHASLWPLPTNLQAQIALAIFIPEAFLFTRSFHVTLFCFCPPPPDLRGRKGSEISSVRYNGNDDDDDKDLSFSYFSDIGR